MELLLLLFSVYVGTGGDDNVVRMWDLRQKKSVYTIPAHTSLVSYMKFQGIMPDSISKLKFWYGNKC